MNIEEIMKPYFDKKEELEKKQQVNDKYIEEIRIINLRLERLRDNKEREIEEYVQNAVADRPDFYAGYGAMIRKDLEQAYAAKEQELQDEIKELEEKIEANSRELSKYYKVDVRELVDVKHDLRKTLISAKKELEIKLQETQIQFDTIMLQLSTFKYEYDENHNVLNGNKYRELFEKSNELIEVKHNLQKDLNQLEEYLKITELTEEEVKIVMMSMTDFEKEEYDRRKVQSISPRVEFKVCEEIGKTEPEIASKLSENLNELIIDYPELRDKLVNLSAFQPDFTKVLSNLIKEYPKLSDAFLSVLEVVKRNEEKESEVQNVVPEPKKELPVEEKTEEPEEIDEELNKKAEEKREKEQQIYEEAERAIEQKNELEENYSEFIKEIFGDVVGSVKKLRAVRLDEGKYLSSSIPGQDSESYEIDSQEDEQIELVNGLYLNQKDIEKALGNYVRQNKGRSFTVKGIDLALNVTRKSVKKVKEILRDAGTKKLLIEKKLSLFDIKRVFGKKKAEKYDTSLKVDASKVNMPAGTYVHVSDVYNALKELFTEKTPTWFERLTSKFRRPDLEELDEVPYAEYEQLDDELTWDAEEPEYEIVRAKTR